MVAITISGLSKRFGPQPVLTEIDLHIEHGELFFLLGPSGCGKTTLLRHIAGFYQPDTGSICFDGEDVSRIPVHRRDTGMMFQSYALWPHLSVAENIAFGLQERRVPKSECLARVSEALALVQMQGFEDRRIQQLSGGQQQRVALARALVVRPKCLLLDEPLSNLDAKLRLEMRTEIRRVCKRFGLTAVYVTHDRDEALSLADRLAVMQAGRIAQVGTPMAIYRRPVDAAVADFIGETNLLPARVVALSGDQLYRVETAVGIEFARAHRPDWQPRPGDPVMLSVRPESPVLGDFLADTVNSFPVRIIEATYLGPIVQYRAQPLAGPPELKLTVLNPTRLLGPDAPPLSITVAADDVVMLPG